MVLVACLFLGNQHYVFAEEVDVRQEYLDKKAAGVEVYEITRENGDFIGYYEPGSNDVTDNNTERSSSYDIGKWTIPSNTTSGINKKLSLIKGDKITINISQKPNGSGYPCYLALKDVDTGVIDNITHSITTNGWKNCTITIGYSGHFNFAINNISGHSITFTGSFSY